jgi:hypothetical protein
MGSHMHKRVRVCTALPRTLPVQYSSQKFKFLSLVRPLPIISDHLFTWSETARSDMADFHCCFFELFFIANTIQSFIVNTTRWTCVVYMYTRAHMRVQYENMYVRKKHNKKST